MKIRISFVIVASIVFMLIACKHDNFTSFNNGESSRQEAVSSIYNEDYTPESAPESIVTSFVRDITPLNTEAIKHHIQINPDTIGWLSIPNTEINSVIVRPKDASMFDYYSYHDFYGDASQNGWYFIDFRCGFGNGTRNQLPINTVIYAHSWSDDPNGEFFSQIKKYKDYEYAKRHPYLFFSTEEQDIAWEIFAVYDAYQDFPYNFPYNFENPEDYPIDELLRDIRACSIYNYSLDASPEDKFLTLVTCVFNVEGHSNIPNDSTTYRFIVLAKMVDPMSPKKDYADMTINPSPLAPDELISKYVPSLKENAE